MNRSKFFIGLAVVLVVLVVGGVLVVRLNSGPQDVALSCIGGSEKSDLIRDPEVTKILDEDYGITLDWRPMGSYDQVQLSTEDLQQREVDCLWPSSASAQFVFEAQHPDQFPDYRAETVLQSPEVIYAGPQGTQALIDAGLVELRDGTYYVVDLHRLLIEHSLTGATWQSLQAGDLQGPINISSTDPVKSNSGFTMAQLELTTIASADPNRPPTIEEARAALPTMRAIYDAQGLQATSSDNGFRQWLTQGGEYTAPLYAGYESQIIQVVVAGSQGGNVLDKVNVLYPEPTIYSDHPVLALNPEAGNFIEALKDERIQKIAWSKYGFRSSVNSSWNDLGEFGSLPLAAQFRTVPAPNHEVTLALLSCLQDRTTC